MRRPTIPIKDSELVKEFIEVVDRPHLSPDYVGAKSHLKVKWQCKNNHPTWIASPASRVQYGKTSACPYCAGIIVIIGENDLVTLRPEIANQWDSKKNRSKPNEHTSIEIFRAHWICEKGHEWSARIADRVRFDTGCPYCSNRKVLAGVNDFTLDHPELIEEWDYEKNPFPPENYAGGNKNQFFWKHFHIETQTWHSWKTSILNRTKNKSKCAYCSNSELLAGFNDFETLAPEIAKQWDNDKNNTLPSSHLYGSHSKAWWLCDKGHSWNTSIKARCSGSGCGKCRLVATSKIEQAFHAAFKKRLDTINESYTDKIIIDGKKYQVDIFGTLNGEKIAIEYDGKYYHTNTQKRDIEKTKIFLNNGYRVIRIRENGLEKLSFQHINLIQVNFVYSLDEEDIKHTISKALKGGE